MRRAWKLGIVVASMWAAPAAAHERSDRVMGVVESVSAEQILIESADDGHTVAFAVTRETRFFSGGKPARLEDVRVGQRAVVHGRRAGQQVVAVRVKVSAPR
jgi:alpha-D-ribose 1-methylphosphonate 5-triphosphate synthase subunit PhnI